MSRILLIKPRFLVLENRSINHPIGLMYIGASLRKAGHEPKIHDGAPDDENLTMLRRTIKDWKPDLVGISIIVTECEQTKKIMAVIRELMPDVPVIFGGPWPSANAEESLKHFGADFVVLGEGELAFPELVNALNKNLPTHAIEGTASVVNGSVKINQGRYLTDNELDSLPFPAWELLDRRLYEKTPSMSATGKRSYMTIVTSRGCSFQCAYCHQTMGRVFRKRTAESVLAEMEELYFKHGIREFEIVDDCFNLDHERMHKILGGIRNKFARVKLHFPNGLRADMLESEDVVLLKQAGTVSACFAIETSSPRLQRMIKKNLNIDKAVETMNASVKVGIYSTGFFMIGLPTETYQEAADTVDFAVRSSLHRALFFHAIPFAGTKLADMAEDFLRNKNDRFDPKKVNYFTSTLNISAMSDRELQGLLRSAYRRFYLHPKRIARLVTRHPEFSSLPYYASLALVKMLPGKRNP